MDPDWNDSQPIYRQIRDRVVAMILDGDLKAGDPLPSVRNVAVDTRVNPLTVLKAILGLIPYEGELRVLGRDPWTGRDALMRDVCFIADVAVMPRWMRVSQSLDYMAGVHPRFDRAAAERFLGKTQIKRSSRI